MTENTDKLLCFVLDERMFALPVKQVVMVSRAVAVTTVPDASSLFYGVIDVHGDIVPVINLRQRFALPAKSISIADRFIIVDSGKRKLALVADAVEGVREITEGDYQETSIPAHNEKTGNNHNKVIAISRFFRDNEGIVIIYDVEELLSDAGSSLLERLEALMREGLE